MVRWVSLMLVICVATAGYADLDTYVFSGSIVAIVYEDDNGNSIEINNGADGNGREIYRDIEKNIIENQPFEITEDFSGFLNELCTYVFNVDYDLPGYYADDDGVERVRTDISETQDGVNLTVNYFFSELQEGVLLTDEVFPANDLTDKKYGMEFESNGLYGINLIDGPESKYINISSKNPTQFFREEWDAGLVYVGTEYISLGSYSVSLKSDLTFPTEEPEPVSEPGAVSLFLFGLSSVFFTLIWKRVKHR